MLVLSRKDNEQIFIDGEICIRVLSIRGNTVRLGIEAPAEVAIRRAEITSARKVSDGNVKPTATPQSEFPSGFSAPIATP